MAMNSLLFLSCLKEKCTMSNIKTVCRTLFYQFFALFVGISVGFIINPEWAGIKGLIINKSIHNIFFPIEYDENMERLVKGWGAYAIYIKNNTPNDFEIIDEHVFANEEFYWCRFKYRDKQNKLMFAEDTHRVRWKTWEYYYQDSGIINDTQEAEDLLRLYENDINKRKKEIEESKKREERIVEEEQLEKLKKGT